MVRLKEMSWSCVTKDRDIYRSTTTLNQQLRMLPKP